MAAVAWQKLSPLADMTASIPSQAGAAAASGAAMPDERLCRATRAMRLKDYDLAAKLLSQEVAEKPGSFIVYDLRAACWLQRGRHEQALDDAMHCTKLNPEWARGWARLGAAQLCLGHMRPALSAYRRGLELEPASKEMQLGVQLAQQALLAAQGNNRRRAIHHDDVDC